MEKPTLEEVRLRVSKKYFYVNADDFYEYHEKTGWKIKNWKISLGMWEHIGEKNKPIDPNGVYLMTGLPNKKQDTYFSFLDKFK